MTTSKIKPLVASVLEGGDSSDLLKALMTLDRDDRQGQAAIRLLISQKKWDFTAKGESNDAINHLFGAFDGRHILPSAEYMAVTHDIILDLWGVDIQPPVAAKLVEPNATEKTTAKKTVAKKRVSRKISEVSDTTIDTRGASERLKKVIEIQRNG